MVISMGEFANVLYEKAFKIWGADAQIQMAVEEAGELIVSLAKLQRASNGATVDDVLDELVDNEIMNEQMRLIFDYTVNGQSQFVKRKAEKLNRLAARLDSFRDKEEKK